MPAARRRLLVRATIAVAGVRAAYFVLPFSLLRAVLARLGARPGPRGGRSVDDLARAVSAAGRRVPGANCLVQALALELLLAREGDPGVVRIGVAKDNGRLKAHAWVEMDGRVVLGEEESDRFTLLTGAGRAAR